MTIGCFAGFIIDYEKLFLVGTSLMFAILMLLALRKTQSTKYRIGLIYAHLSFLFFPFTLFTTEFSCAAVCAPCGGTDLLGLALLSLPTTLAFSTVAGFVLIPTFYVLTNQKYEIRDKNVKSFVKTHSKKLSIKEPKIYAINKSKPMSFSFRSHKSAIFLSIGLTEILRKKELQAVLLHELAHIKEKSSALKFSHAMMRIFSPFSRLAGFHDTGKEEYKADEFVIKMQKTDKHLLSAKSKIDEFK
mgnify:FL=1